MSYSLEMTYHEFLDQMLPEGLVKFVILDGSNQVVNILACCTCEERQQCLGDGYTAKGYTMSNIDSFGDISNLEIGKYYDDQAGTFVDDPV